MLKVSTGQLSIPVRSAFALLPAETIEQYVAPAEEYEPVAAHAAHSERDEAPVSEYFPEGQARHGSPSFRVASKYLPGGHSEQLAEPAALGPLSQRVQVLVPPGE